MADIHSIDCTCDGIDFEEDIASAGTRCECFITQAKKGDIVTEPKSVAMIDLRKVM